MLIKNFCIRSQKYNFFLKFKRIFFVRLHHVGEINFLYTLNKNFNLYCSNRMKKMASKIGSLFTACLVIAILLFSNSCGNKGYTPLNIDPDFAGYVISFTSGVVSKTSKVVVRLVQEMPNVKPGDELAFNPFHFSPKIKGKAIWKDAQTIEFIPEKRLESGEEYVATFSLNKFASVPKKLKKLKFNFMVMKQGIQYEFNGIEPYNDYDKKWQKVKGVFTTADYADASELEPAVEAFDHSKDYKIKWEHSPDGKTHNFTIDSVLRTTSAFEIKLKWKGEEMCEDDLTNSQPLFLAVLMKNTLPLSKLFNPEFNNYFDAVKNGLLYEIFMERYNIQDRGEMKNMMYRVLFGSNNDKHKYNVMFRKVFPNV